MRRVAINRWNLMVILLCISTGQYADATEIVIANSADGLVITSDKRATLLKKPGTFDDRATKVRMNGTILYSRMGSALVLQKRKGHRISTKYFTNIEYNFGNALKDVEADGASLYDPSTTQRISENLAKLLSADAAKYGTSWTVASLGDIDLFAIKKRSNARAIEIALFSVFTDANHAQPIECKPDARAVLVPDRPFLMTFKPTHDDDLEHPKAVFSTWAEARDWSEKEIAMTHQRQKKPKVGNTVDEFLVGYDGQIKQIAERKIVCAK